MQADLRHFESNLIEGCRMRKEWFYECMWERATERLRDEIIVDRAHSVWVCWIKVGIADVLLCLNLGHILTMKCLNEA